MYSQIRPLTTRAKEVKIKRGANIFPVYSILIIIKIIILFMILLSNHNVCTYPIQCIQPDTQRISCFQPRKQKMKKVKDYTNWTNMNLDYIQCLFTYNTYICLQFFNLWMTKTNVACRTFKKCLWIKQRSASRICI